MSVADDLQERERQAGNESDGLDPSQRAYDEKFNPTAKAPKDEDFNTVVANNYGADAPRQKVDAHGDTIQRNYNADEPDEESSQSKIQKKEKSGSSIYQPGSQFESRKNPLQRMFSKRGSKPTAGVTAALTFAGAIMLSMAGGSSFWMALEKNLTNESANDSRTNLVMRRAFNNMIGSSACGKVQLVCKMKTATKEQVKKWRDGFFKVRGQVVDAQGNPVRGSPNDVIDPDKMKEGERVKVSSLEFRDGYEARSGPAFNEHADNNVRARSMVSRVVDPLRSDFLHGKFGKLLQKFGLSKGRATPEEKKVNEVTKKLAEDEARKASASVDPSDPKNLLKTAVKSAQGIAGTGATAAQIACMAYNITRVSVGAVKAVWVTDLIRFGWPFFRLISKMADGSATSADFQEIEDRFTRLVDYLSPSKAEDLKEKIDKNTLTDEDKEEMQKFGISTDDLKSEEDKRKAKEQIDDIKGKNAFDSQGLRMMLYGDKTKLTDFTKKFTTGAIGGGAVVADSILKWTQDAFGGGDIKEGKRNIRTACIAANTLANGIAAANLAQCFLPTVVSQVKCVGDFLIGAAKWVSIFVAAQKAMELVIPALIGLGVDKVILDNDLRGPAAGDAIAAAMGLFLTRKSQSSGLKPAISQAAIASFVSSTDDTYNKYGPELARYDARSEPFNINNRYSFMGQIVQSLNPYPTDPTKKTGFSFLANVFGVLSNTILPTAQALHSQPALLTIDRATLASRINNGVCRDSEKWENDMLCDWSGQAIMISSPRVLKWAEEDATGKTDHLSEVIKWMQEPQSDDEGSGSNSGTKDETCGLITQFSQALGKLSVSNCIKSGDLASIDKEGKTIPDSQFDQYIKYCTGERALEMGSTDLDTGSGSAKEQDWHSGKQCTKDSYMMDAFAYYYNMCYVQYAIANNATDCTNDEPPALGAAATSTKGNGSILETAKEMGTWGAKYNSCYTYGGGHGKSKEWVEEAIKNHFTGEYAVDCSAFIRAVVLQATGNDIGDVNTQSLCADTKNFEHVPREQAQPGDIAIDCVNHVEVITEVNDGKFKTVGSHTTGCGEGFGSSPGNYQGTETFVLRYKGGQSV